jgi:hypothetical protein
MLRAGVGEVKYDGPSCGCPVEMGVHSVEEAPATAKKTNAVARPTGRPGGEEH